MEEKKYPTNQPESWISENPIEVPKMMFHNKNEFMEKRRQLYREAFNMDVYNSDGVVIGRDT